MRVAVTGGLGSVGTYLSRRLARAGHCVVVYDNLSKKSVEKNWKILERESRIEIRICNCLDITDYGDVDAIVHLAADCSSARSLASPLRSFYLNALVTCHVLEAARKRLIPVVYASSVRAYPNAAGQRTLYGLSKWVGDLLCTEYARTYGVPTISNRFGGLYGVYQYGTCESGWLNWFVKAVVHQLPLELQGDGSQKRDCLHNEDTARLLVAQTEFLVRERICDGRVYDIGGGMDNFVSLADVLRYLHDVYGYSLQNVRQVPRRHADVEGRPASNAGVWQDFHWRPTISVWEGIDEMVEAERRSHD